MPKKKKGIIEHKESLDKGAIELSKVHSDNELALSESINKALNAVNLKYQSEYSTCEKVSDVLAAKLIDLIINDSIGVTAVNVINTLNRIATGNSVSANGKSTNISINNSISDSKRRELRTLSDAELYRIENS